MWEDCLYSVKKYEFDTQNLIQHHTEGQMLKIQTGSGVLSMGRSGKMRVTHYNGIGKTATVQNIWPNQNRQTIEGHLLLYFGPDIQ